MQKKFTFHSEYVWNFILTIWLIYLLFNKAPVWDLVWVGIFFVTSEIQIATLKIKNYIDEKVTFEEDEQE